MPVDLLHVLLQNILFFLCVVSVLDVFFMRSVLTMLQLLHLKASTSDYL